MKFLKNTWYAAAWATELGATGLLGRTILGQPVVMFRTEDGKAVAIGGRCPHRFAPLHLGRHVGNAVQCGYHGLQFGADGRCSKSPHGAACQGSVPKYSLVERHAVLWVWMGEATPDEDLIPESPAFMSDARRAESHGRLSVAANYQLLNDNLMDLSHGLYLHNGSLASTEMQRHYSPRVGQDGPVVTMDRESPDIAPTTLWRPALPIGTQRVDLFSHLRWDAPSIVWLKTGCRPVGQPTGSIGELSMLSAHMFTPETEFSTHYFWSTSRDFALDSEEIGAHFEKIVSHAFINEDKPMLEAVQQMMGTSDLMALKPILLATDNAAVRVRRVLSSLISAEQTSDSAVPARTI